MQRKLTAWRKSRKFGDIYGGRQRIKCDDNIFRRHHSLTRPEPDDVLPIITRDNPSRDYFYPIEEDQIRAALKSLPRDHTEDITHVWLRRIKTQDFMAGRLPFAVYIFGSGVRLIVLYAWPRKPRVTFSRLNQPFASELTRLGIAVSRSAKGWTINPSVEQLQRFYIQTLLLHEVGHNVDWAYGHCWWAGVKRQEDFANQYAALMGPRAIKATVEKPISDDAVE